MQEGTLSEEKGLISVSGCAAEAETASAAQI